MSHLMKDDPRIAALIDKERIRIEETLDMIAAENHAPPSSFMSPSPVGSAIYIFSAMKKVMVAPSAATSSAKITFINGGRRPAATLE